MCVFECSYECTCACECMSVCVCVCECVSVGALFNCHTRRPMSGLNYNLYHAHNNVPIPYLFADTSGAIRSRVSWAA